MNLRRVNLFQCISGLFFAIGAMGCTTAGMVQTAQTVGKGNYEVSIDPGLNGVFGILVPYPAVHVAYRYGVTDRVDLGARIGTNLAELQSKFLLTDPMNPSVAVSVVPTAGVTYYPGASSINTVDVFLPLLIGFKLDSNEFTLGPRIQNSFYIGRHSATHILSPGLSIGYAAQVNDKFRVLPELSTWTPVLASSTDGEALAPYTPGAFYFSFNVGLQIGPRRKKVTEFEQK